MSISISRAGRIFSAKFRSKNCLGIWVPQYCRGALVDLNMNGQIITKQFVPEELLNRMLHFEHSNQSGFELASTLPTDNGEYEIVHRDYNAGCLIKKVKIEDGKYQLWDELKSDTGWGKPEGGWTQPRSISRIGKWVDYIVMLRTTVSAQILTNEEISERIDELFNAGEICITVVGLVYDNPNRKFDLEGAIEEAKSQCVGY